MNGPWESLIRHFKIVNESTFSDDVLQAPEPIALAVIFSSYQPCTTILRSIYDRNGSKRKNVTIAVLNVDSDTANMRLAHSFGITCYPSFVFFMKGRPSPDVLTGKIDVADFESWLDSNKEKMNGNTHQPDNNDGRLRLRL